MVGDKQISREDVQQELKALADRVPEILSTGLLTVDNTATGFYSKTANPQDEPIDKPLAGKGNIAEEDRITAISAATHALSERIISEIHGSEWECSVVMGRDATIVELFVDDNAILIAIVHSINSMDAILTELKATRERLL